MVTTRLQRFKINDNIMQIKRVNISESQNPPKSINFKLKLGYNSQLFDPNKCQHNYI
jgi:hypothetical protein